MMQQQQLAVVGKVVGIGPLWVVFTAMLPYPEQCCRTQSNAWGFDKPYFVQ
jgi:hypothetical protein